MANDFKPSIGGKVPKVDADKWIKEYDKKRKDKDKDTKSVFFGKDVLQQIIDTPGAAGISFFFASKYSEWAKKDVDTLVLVPTKEDGTLIWPKDVSGKDGEEMGWDDGAICPPTCPNP
jgi:hypothetical protein